MSTLSNFFTRKVILTTSLILTAIFVILFLDIPYSFCKEHFSIISCRSYREIFNFLAILFFLAPPALLIGLLSIKYNEGFNSWRKFTFIYLFIYLL